MRSFYLFLYLLPFACLAAGTASAQREHSDDHAQIEQSLRAQLGKVAPGIVDLQIGQINFSMEIENIIELFSDQGFRHAASGNRHQFDRRGTEPVTDDDADTGEYIIRLGKDGEIISIEYRHFKPAEGNEKSWDAGPYAGQTASYMKALCSGLSPSPSDVFVSLACPTPGKIEENSNPLIRLKGIEGKDGAIYSFTSKTYAKSHGFGHEVDAQRIVR